MKPEKRKGSSEYHPHVGRDRLSEMPDEVLVNILSCMPTFHAVRTMLIRPFGNLWTLVHTLNFDTDEFVIVTDSGDDFVDDCIDVVRFNSFVSNVLMLHKRPFIDKFLLLLGEYYENGSKGDGDDIRMWLKFPFDKQAKEICISFVNFYSTNSTYFLNFTSQSLVTLELCCCSFYTQFQANLGSVKKLVLNHTEMHEEVFQQLICGCPSLAELHIEQLPIVKMRFSAPNIRKLSLVILEGNDFDDPWSLDAPNLKSLYLETNCIPDVIDVSSIRDVYLQQLYVDVDYENEHRRHNIFWDKFSGCEVFQISSVASEQFLHSIYDLNHLQIRWKRVVLRLRAVCQSCLLGFYHLMRTSKDLEELEITVCNTPNIYPVQAFRASDKLPPVELSCPCVIPKLKIVTLRGYAKPWDHQLQLIEFLLKSATVLEKLVIYPNEHHEMDFVMRVSSFQRSSSSARLLFL